MRSLNNQNGSVLVTALVIIAVLLTLFLSAFSYGIARYSVHAKRHHQAQAMYLAESGINRLVALLNSDEVSIEEITKKPISILIDDHGEFNVSVRPYGGYMLVQSKGRSGSQESMRQVLLGSDQKAITNNALTVLDNRFPIVATGLTNITGNMLTGPVQLTTGQIEGKGIISKNFHSGLRIIIDSVISPYYSYNFIDDYVKYIYQQLKPDAHSVSTSLKLVGEDDFLSRKSVVEIHGNIELLDFTIKRPNNPLTLIVSGWVDISGNCEILGLVEIVSEKFIKVSNSSICSDCVLYAEDSILLSDFANISAQAISRQQITISDLVDVRYPSLLMVNTNSFSDRGEYGIRVSSKGSIDANTMYISSDTLRQRDNEIIEIDSMTDFTGVLYSSDYINLAGNVTGSVIARNFKFEISPTTYINWLKDVNINRIDLDYTPIMPISDKDTSHFDVIYLGSSYE